MKFELPYSKLPIEIEQWLTERTGQWQLCMAQTKLTETKDGSINGDPAIVINIPDEKVAVLFALTWM